jgi:uncharacterized membrane protein required for colicin V production
MTRDLLADLAAISLESIPQISLGTAAIAIFVICAALTLMRGLTRIFIGSLVIAASAWVGFWAWQNAPAIGIRFVGKPLPWLSIAWPAIACLLSFVVLRKLVNFIVRPFGKSTETQKSPIRRAFGLLFALVPAGLLSLVGAMLLHHAGSVAEVRHYVDASKGDTGYSQLFTSLKASVENAIPSAWIRTLDPSTNHARLNLAKLISASAEDSVPPKATLILEEPILRAIVVDEKELRGLAREKRFGTLLSHPSLDKALNDPRVKKALDRLDLE